MMLYNFFLVAEPNTGPEPGSDAFVTYMRAYRTFNEETNAAGVFVAGEAVEAADTATTLEKQGDEIQYHDGPFAELKEQISGWYVVNCENLEDALKWAAKVPLVAYGFGRVEVRPVMDVSQMLEL